MLELKPTKDILMEVSKYKEKNMHPSRVVGFAAESQNLILNATQKLQNKGLDLIIANDISSSVSGFNVETNLVALIYPDGRVDQYPLLTKEEVAEIIINKVADWF